MLWASAKRLLRDVAGPAADYARVPDPEWHARSAESKRSPTPQAEHLGAVLGEGVELGGSVGGSVHNGGGLGAGAGAGGGAGGGVGAGGGAGSEAGPASPRRPVSVGAGRGAVTPPLPERLSTPLGTPEGLAGSAEHHAEQSDTDSEGGDVLRSWSALDREILQPFFSNTRADDDVPAFAEDDR